MTKSFFEYVFFFVAIGAFRSSLSFRTDVVPSKFRFVIDRMLCLLIVGIHALKNFDSTIFIDVIRMKSYVETKLGHAIS